MSRWQVDLFCDSLSGHRVIQRRTDQSVQPCLPRRLCHSSGQNTDRRSQNRPKNIVWPRLKVKQIDKRVFFATSPVSKPRQQVTFSDSWGPGHDNAATHFFILSGFPRTAR